MTSVSMIREMCDKIINLDGDDTELLSIINEAISPDSISSLDDLEGIDDQSKIDLIYDTVSDQAAGMDIDIDDEDDEDEDYDDIDDDEEEDEDDEDWY